MKPVVAWMSNGRAGERREDGGGGGRGGATPCVRPATMARACTTTRGSSAVARVPVGIRRTRRGDMERAADLEPRACVSMIDLQHFLDARPAPVAGSGRVAEPARDNLSPLSQPELVRFVAWPSTRRSCSALSAASGRRSASSPRRARSASPRSCSGTDAGAGALRCARGQRPPATSARPEEASRVHSQTQAAAAGSVSPLLHTPQSHDQTDPMSPRLAARRALGLTTSNQALVGRDPRRSRLLRRVEPEHHAEARRRDADLGEVRPSCAARRASYDCRRAPASRCAAERQTSRTRSATCEASRHHCASPPV